MVIYTLQLCRSLENRLMRNNYYIHSNEQPGGLDKSFWAGAFMFQYLLQGSIQKWMI